MKKLKIITRRQALSRLADSLFRSGGTLSPFPLDTGKYKWYGSESSYIGREVDASDSVDCVYVERRQDSDGVYCRVMCMTTHNNNILKPTR
jgi:hypothetical protein